MRIVYAALSRIAQEFAMQPTVAIAEDEEDLREAVAEYLGDRGLQVLQAADAATLRSLVAQHAVDVAILDIAMPGEDGLALARWLRARGKRPGIIFATAASAAVDRIVGLELGADDYVVKPYDLRELLARIRSVLRRLPEGSGPVGPAATTGGRRVVAVGALSLDLDRLCLTDAGGTRVELTAAEISLLEALATRPNRALSRAQLLELTGHRGAEGADRSIDVRITRLRRKIEADPERPVLIRTLWGEGYMYVPDRSG